jgi:outer membrane protein insertion porin family
MNLRYFAATPEGGQKPLEIKITNRRPGDQPYGEIPTIDLQEVIRAKLEAAGLQAGSDGEGGVVRARFQDPGDDPPRRDGGWQAQDGATRSVTRAPARVAQAPVDDPLPPIEPPAIGDVPPALEAPPVEGGIPPVIAPGPPVVQVPVLPGGPGAEGPRTPPIGSGEPPGTFPSLPGANMTDVGPDRSDPFPNRSYADIVTQVDEVPTGRLMFGLGATSYGGLSGSFILHESNFDLFALPRSLSDFRNGSAFRGAGQDFRVELSPGTLINRAVVSFRDPYLFDLPIGLGLSGYYFQRIYNGLYTENRGGGRFSLGRQFGTQIYGDVAFRIEDVDFHGFTNPAPASYLAAAGHTTLATLRPSLRFDNRNDPFSPNKGQYLEAAFEQGWGTFTFPKFTVEGRQYVPLGSRPDGSGKRFLTLRGYYGITGTDTPVYERFYAGDFRSMRGFTYRGVGPRELNVNVGGLSMALGSVEFQFPWTANDKLQQVIFTDFGTVSNTLDLTGFRLAVGTGLRIYLPQQAFGPLPLAFDFAVPIVKEEGDRTQYFTFFIGAFW